MLEPAAVADWILVVTALPPALAAFLVLFGRRIIHHVTASNSDRHLRDRVRSNLSFRAIASAWVFSVAVGCAALLIDWVLIHKGLASLGQWRVLASVILAAADAFLPVGVLVLFVLAMRGLFKML
ncbi:MAG TPA: hypothetical protein VF508_07070 [Pyrinomonadaceae bacterium]